jgi:hypothetical protein
MCPRYRPCLSRSVGRGIALLFHDRGTRRWVSGQQHAPAALYPPGKTRYPLYRKLGGPHGRSGRVENLVPNGIRSRTIQPVVQSLYRLNYPAHKFIYILCIFCLLYIRSATPNPKTDMVKLSQYITRDSENVYILYPR